MSHEAKRQKVEFVLALLRKGVSTSDILRDIQVKWGNIPKKTVENYITEARTLLEAEHKEISSNVIESIQKQAKTIVASVISKYEIVHKLQKDVEELELLIEQGYIYRRIIIDVDEDTQDVIEKKEGFGVAEIEKLHKAKDAKIAKICDLLGYYGEDKEQQHTDEVITAKSLTREELQERIKNLEKD